MESILLALIAGVLNGAIDFMDEMLTDLAPMALYADQYMNSSAGESMVDVLFDILLGFGVSLIILKFLKKGYGCYVMWTDGDPDSEPAGLVIRFIEAVVIAVCFPLLYSWLASIAEGLIDKLLVGIGASTDIRWHSWVSNMTSAGLVTAIFGLIFLIC